MDYDAIVIGLGGLGSAAAYRLATRPGVRVLGLEQFELGHDRGASQDESRIIRLSYHRPEYVALAKRAYAAWDEVESASGQRIVTVTGGLDLAPEGAAESIDDYAAAMASASVPFECLDDGAIRSRWPQWRLPPNTRGLFQAAGGIADPSIANAAHRRLARALGATLVEHAPVTAIRAAHGEVAVTAAVGGRARTFTAGSVIVATDAWTNDLLGPLGWPLELRVTREQVTWFDTGKNATDASAFDPDAFPVWIWLDDPSFYGFPSHRGRGPKVGQDVGGRDTTATTRTFDADPDALARVQRFVADHLPTIGPPRSTKTCLYTLTPDRDFVVDRLPDAPEVVAVLGAAHAFKFAALLGSLLADLALDPAGARPGPELDLFRIDRPGLRRAQPAQIGESRAEAPA
jgi:monomeric sarcosine oxidase